MFHRKIAIVAIDTREQPALVKAMQRAATAVEADHIFVWCGPDNEKWARDVFFGSEKDGNKGKHKTTQTFLSVLPEEQLPTTPERYSHLLLNIDPIWSKLQKMGVRHVLFVQSDVVIVRRPTHHELGMWQRFDYIGAPWTAFNPCRKMVPHGVGNGGVSLRSVSACIDALEKIKKHQRDAWPEDVFFAHTIDADRIAPINIAAGFACEVPIDGLHTPLAAPFALHKPRSFCPPQLLEAWDVRLEAEDA